jgi:5S rRNA maturation endonuclease (ribonuclease M5)
LAAAGGEEVWVVEGEKDVHSLEELDKVATTSPGGAGKWKPEFAERLKGDRIRIVADDDEPGFTYRGCTRNPMQTVDSGAVGAMPSRIRSKPSRTERPGPALRSGL